MRAGEQLSHRKSLSEVVFERLQHAIKSGAYQSDERLPTEHELAAEFQVSRPVVRDALKRLRDQGLVYSRQGAGSFVRIQGLRQPLGFGPLENIADLQNCYEFRMTMEPEAAALAAERHSETQIRVIRLALETLQDATNRQRHREDADFMFHLAIAQASGNSYFSTAMEALKDHIAIGMQFHGLSLKNSVTGLRHVYDEHAAIYEAIRDRKPNQARELMRQHIRGSRDRLFEGRRPEYTQGG
ncbi:HTH-type transcriptional regulator LutR [Ensifer psoraleae]|uniref:FadR/GntR family transcriptional regulator n=1 Tax=Sinorhizobium TaxID=28105 RepID=UPI001568A341|nr:MULTISPECIES: FadR/GntR family transcriptional regulator [Sinorhizobium]MDK1386017.1 FadR/GntR family transcriptional regulator [Sinorhizobium sp. 7-81]NRP73145.1 HTH-type transcriptional regulator LutR [Sinorhizobium psoraleae]